MWHLNILKNSWSIHPCTRLQIWQPLCIDHHYSGTTEFWESSMRNDEAQMIINPDVFAVIDRNKDIIKTHQI